MADRYLLESSAVDGYLLEDGSGVLLLDFPELSGTASVSHVANATVLGFPSDARTTPPYQRPNALISSFGGWDSTSVNNVDDDPEAPDSLNNTTVDNDGTLKYSFPTPSYVLSTVTNAHKLRIRASRVTGDFTAYLLKDGLRVEDQIFSVVIGTTDQIYEIPFSLADIGGSGDGVGVELEFWIAGVDPSASVAAVDWYAPEGGVTGTASVSHSSAADTVGDSARSSTLQASSASGATATGTKDASGIASASGASGITQTGVKGASGTITASVTASEPTTTGVAGRSGSVAVSASSATSATGDAALAVGGAAEVSHSHAATASGVKATSGVAVTSSSTSTTQTAAKGSFGVAAESASSASTSTGSAGKQGAITDSLSTDLSIVGASGRSGVGAATATAAANAQGTATSAGEGFATVNASSATSASGFRATTGSIIAAHSAITSLDTSPNKSGLVGLLQTASALSTGATARLFSLSENLGPDVSLSGMAARLGVASEVSAASSTSATGTAASALEGVATVNHASSTSVSGSADKSTTLALSVQVASVTGGAKGMSGAVSEGLVSTLGAAYETSRSGMISETLSMLTSGLGVKDISSLLDVELVILDYTRRDGQVIDEGYFLEVSDENITANVQESF